MKTDIPLQIIQKTPSPPKYASYNERNKQKEAFEQLKLRIFYSYSSHIIKAPFLCGDISWSAVHGISTDCHLQKKSINHICTIRVTLSVTTLG